MYAHWITQQIEDMDLEEGVDFEFLPLKAKTSPKGGRPAKDYYLTVAAAKEGVMVAGEKENVFQCQLYGV